ncbi:MAG: hypothetical protein NC115_05970 [Bacteroidales bacterium]|nr:hypothetical protein [Bacteroides sp.]MCM1197521.1 hypothetical protein [Clostridium sp.]MCM1502196.1 hypothetical protein [Bacteroidales bacterium]
MEPAFIYDRPVTGKNFIGRKNECNALSNLLDKRENIVIYEPSKSGKQSVVQQALFSMRSSGRRFCAASLDMFNIRSIGKFLVRFGSAIVRSSFSSPAEYAEVAGKYLAGTHFTFDQDAFSANDEVISLPCNPDRADMEAMMRLPGKIAADRGEEFIAILEEFQNILEDKEYETLFKVMEQIFSEKMPDNVPGCTFILSGSKVNAMKYIFEDRRFFYRQVEHLPVGQIDEREIIEHIRKGFLSGGKVFEKEQALGACRLFRNNIWYINHFCSICNSLSLGYINEGIMLEALNILLSIHRPRFESIMYSLTGYQVSLLQAVLDGVVKFSATEIINRYSLNSSANVKRVKEALMKKEIITFDERQEPVILDPLFEYWVSRFYFERSI